MYCDKCNCENCTHIKKAEQRAFDQISKAKNGYLVNKNEPYLTALRVKVAKWLEEIDTELRIIDQMHP